MAANINELRALTSPEGMPFKIQRLGHVVLQVSNLSVPRVSTRWARIQ